jgi:hypothetical protein
MIEDPYRHYRNCDYCGVRYEATRHNQSGFCNMRHRNLFYEEKEAKDPYNIAKKKEEEELIRYQSTPEYREAIRARDERARISRIELDAEKAKYRAQVEKLKPVLATLNFDAKNGRNCWGDPYPINSKEWIKWQKEYAPPPTYKLEWKSKSIKSPFVVMTMIVFLVVNWILLRDGFEYGFEIINSNLLFLVNFVILLPLFISFLKIKKEQIVLDNTIINFK